MDSVNFVMNNPELLESPGFSCIASQFDLEKGAPIERNPEEWSITRLYSPPEHDLSLGYSFECSVGMTPDQATQLYQEIVQMLGEKINTFPDNYSLSDGLLYLGHHQKKDIAQRLTALTPA